VYTIQDCDSKTYNELYLFVWTLAEMLEDHKRKEEIMSNLQIPRITEFTEYKRNWKENIHQMRSERIPKKYKK
jgi:hypothetical protein